MIAVVETAELSALIAELAVGQPIGAYFRVRVRARDAFGPGEWSAFLLDLQLAGLPAPQNLRVE